LVVHVLIMVGFGPFIERLLLPLDWNSFRLGLYLM
jgi:hypothetical protein